MRNFQDTFETHKRSFINVFSICMNVPLMFLYIQQYKTVEQKLNHKCAIIHSQDVNIPDKNYNLFSSVKGLSFNFVLIFVTASTIKSFMTSPSWCYACQHYLMAHRNTNFHTRFSRISKLRSVLLLCNYCTIAFYFVCSMGLTLFICGDVELN